MSARSSDLLRLRTIVECIDEVDDTVRELGVTPDSYIYPQDTISRVCRRAIDMLILQLCEEARELTDETRGHAPSIPWTSVAEVRSFLVHSYGSVDAPTVWAVIEGDLPELRDACSQLIAEIESGEYVPHFSSRTRERAAREGSGRAKPK
ncbi:MAG: DUF86 domain-containing protein [Atopobiaceae bacterium]|nr:DUF86 domain-containing protein [Atopobiaceae bacterium]